MEECVGSTYIVCLRKVVALTDHKVVGFSETQRGEIGEIHH